MGWSTARGQRLVTRWSASDTSSRSIAARAARRAHPFKINASRPVHYFTTSHHFQNSVIAGNLEGWSASGVFFFSFSHCGSFCTVPFLRNFVPFNRCARGLSWRRGSAKSFPPFHVIGGPLCVSRHRLIPSLPQSMVCVHSTPGRHDPPKWAPGRCVVFVHVPKTGGV